MGEERKLGRYLLGERLGEGANAVVYRATDTLLKRTVALKILRPALVTDDQAFARFTQEAQVAATLVHPRIAWIWDLGEDQGQYFIALRFVDGPSLDQVMAQKRKLGWDEAIRIVQQAGEALQFAHGRGLVHRDIKPANILVSPTEGAVLTDFGLARAMEAGGTITQTGQMLGTPQYMPPEAWEGKPSGTKADQYALACVLVEMLTGKGPFDAPTPIAVMKRVFDPLELPVELPNGLRDRLARALARNPDTRYPEISDFVASLNRGPQTASPDRAPAVQPVQVAPALTPSQPQTAARSREAILGQTERKIIRLAEGVEMEFCRVISGEFIMGSDSTHDKEAGPGEMPRRKVFLEEYWIGKYPVTNRLYQVFVKATKHPKPKYWPNGKIPKGNEDHPVVEVSWEDVTAFCTWASRVSGKVIRLPGEAEWEKAARGTDGRIYPWGDSSPDKSLANFNKFIGSSTEVGDYPAGASPYGVLDVAGNVWEWTADLYNPYPGNTASDDAQGLRFRVVRGGSWLSNGRYLRTTARNGMDPWLRYDFLGFRCAC